MSRTEAAHDGRQPSGEGPGKDRGPAHWDARYGEPGRLWSEGPNATVAEVVAPMAPGRALDVACGEGRHAVWLAERGWDVTALDFSAVGIGKGRAAAEGRGLYVDWQVADVTTWAPPGRSGYDLVVVAYVHLDADVLRRAASWLTPGGRLVVVGHALRNLTDGVGGPSDPAILHTEGELKAAAEGLDVERLVEVLRPVADGRSAIDLCLVAHRSRP